MALFKMFALKYTGILGGFGLLFFFGRVLFERFVGIFLFQAPHGLQGHVELHVAVMKNSCLYRDLNICGTEGLALGREAERIGLTRRLLTPGPVLYHL